jgi:guanine deaminase
VTEKRDPTAHAEIEAIRDACLRIGSHQLAGCDLYASSEPCPMCLGAIYWARPEAVYFATGRGDAARAGFDDAFIYEEIGRRPGDRRIRMHSMVFSGAEEPFRLWNARQDRVDY